MLILLLLSPAAAFAEEAMSADVELQREEERRNWVNFRVGASSGNQSGRPAFCLEGTPFSFVSVEACGTGSGILHHARDPETAHFRAKVRAYSLHLEHFSLEVLGGLGVAEYQIDADAPGFRFTDAGSKGVETAGPEASAHLRLKLPAIFGFEVVADLEATAAWLPAARDLVIPTSPFHPTVGLTVGAGF
jgi:hypothetical protein